MGAWPDSNPNAISILVYLLVMLAAVVAFVVFVSWPFVALYCRADAITRKLPGNWVFALVLIFYPFSAISWFFVRIWFPIGGETEEPHDDCNYP